MPWPPARGSARPLRGEGEQRPCGPLSGRRTGAYGPCRSRPRGEAHGADKAQKQGDIAATAAHAPRSLAPPPLSEEIRGGLGGASSRALPRDPARLPKKACRRNGQQDLEVAARAPRRGPAHLPRKACRNGPQRLVRGRIADDPHGRSRRSSQAGRGEASGLERGDQPPRRPKARGREATRARAGAGPGKRSGSVFRGKRTARRSPEPGGTPEPAVLGTYPPTRGRGGMPHATADR